MEKSSIPTSPRLRRSHSLASPQNSIHKPTTKNLFRRQDIADFSLSILGFFMGRVMVFGEINLLGIAFTSMFFLDGKAFYPAVFFTMLGIITTFSFTNILKYSICFSILAITNFFFKNTTSPYKNIIKGVACGLSVALSGLAISSFASPYTYYYLINIAEGITTICLSYLLLLGMSVLRGQSKQKKQSLTTEELISLVIIAGGVIVGSADIFLGVISIKYYLATLMILIMSYRGGATTGATTGLILGVFLNLSGFESLGFVVVISTAGLFAGALKEIKKFLVAIGFCLFAMGISFTIVPELFNNDFIFAILLASVTFLIIPENQLINFSNSINPATDNSDFHLNKLKNVTSSKLMNFSRSFQKLSDTFSSLSEKKSSLTKKDINNLIDDAAETVCSSCKNSNYCWKDNFYTTYQSVFTMLSSCEKTSNIDFSILPADFTKNCIKLPTFTDEVAKLFEVYKTNVIWHNRIVESRQLVSSQLAAVSDIILDLTDSLDYELTFDNTLEEELLSHLQLLNIDTDAILVSISKSKKLEIQITLPPTANTTTTIQKIIPVIQSLTQKKFLVEEQSTLFSNATLPKTITFLEKNNFQVVTGIAKTTKFGSPASGDSFSILKHQNNSLTLALSDAMGSGEKAAKDSAAAIELLEEFLASGFSNDLALKLINSVLLLKSSDDSFASLDICNINLTTAETEFTKIGASSTFIIKENEISTIRCSSLPVGIIGDLSPETIKKQLKSGDTVVMITDGILDLPNTLSQNSELWLESLLLELNQKNPQTIAETILNEAKSLSNNTPNDDMSVLVARIC